MAKHHLEPLPTQMGPLQKGFSFSYKPGYNVLVGKNNSGKTNILQYIYDRLYRPSGAKNDLCIIPASRSNIRRDFQIGSSTLGNLNNALFESYLRVEKGPVSNEGIPVNVSELTAILLQEEGLFDQMSEFRKLTEEFGFPTFDLKETQTAFFGSIPAVYQGSGLRSIVATLACLTVPRIKNIIIDEPENSLEPILQKKLATVLKYYSKNKNIFVATHSHLFLDREDPERNHVVSKKNEIVDIEIIKNEEGLVNTTFNLLGSSLSDLYFPNNFLIVEGASDQQICEKIVSLHGKTPLDLKVVSAQGQEQVKNLAIAVENNIKPLVVGTSPYKNKVVVLVDSSVGTELKEDAYIKTMISEGRFIELNAASLEEYIPEELYSLISLEKSHVRDQINTSRYDQKKAIKEDVSKKIAEKIDSVDIARTHLGKIVEAVEKGLGIG